MPRGVLWTERRVHVYNQNQKIIQDYPEGVYDE